MTDDKPPETDRLERLLRQWGAEEGARREEPAAPPPALLRASRPPSPLVRWLPVAAAFILFALAIGLSDRDAVKRLESELARANADLASAHTTLEGLKRDARASNAAAGTTTASTGTDLGGFEAGRTAGIAAAEAEVAGLRKALAEKQALLDRVVNATSTAATPEDARLAVMKAQLDALTAEVTAGKDAMRKIGESSEAAKRDAEKKIRALEGEQAQALALFQRVTQAARMKPDEALRTLQKTARDSQLIRRGTELRDTVPSEAVRRLFDTQEALLTQLDLLDPSNAGEFESFLQRVRTTDLGAQIAEALKSIDGDPAVRAWLIESQLLLSGVQRAG
jgi:hypothetical protein